MNRAGVLEASNAQAGAAPVVASVERAAHGPAAPVVPARATRAEVQEVVDLIWFDPESVPRLRRKPAWQELLEAMETRPLDPEGDDPALANDPKVVEDRRDVFEILVRGTPTFGEELLDVLAQSVREDGRFAPALALVAGDVDFPFDELATLRATVTTVAPLALSDEPLTNAIEAARAFLATPGLLSPPAVAEGLTQRIEDAFSHGKRVVPSGYLEAQRERVLVEQRMYQHRQVFGKKHIRALLNLDDRSRPSSSPPAARCPSSVKPVAAGNGSVPTYLPESVANLLPMYPQFRTRLLAEVALPADRYEIHAAALRVVAIARLSAPPKP
jgi:hypothetical protein